MRTVAQRRQRALVREPVQTRWHQHSTYLPGCYTWNRSLHVGRIPIDLDGIPMCQWGSGTPKLAVIKQHHDPCPVKLRLSQDDLRSSIAWAQCPGAGNKPWKAANISKLWSRWSLNVLWGPFTPSLRVVGKPTGFFRSSKQLLVYALRMCLICTSSCVSTAPDNSSFRSASWCWKNLSIPKFIMVHLPKFQDRPVKLEAHNKTFCSQRHIQNPTTSPTSCPETSTSYPAWYQCEWSFCPHNKSRKQ